MDFHILIVTAVMILLDIAFGVAGAVKNKGVESGKLREGLWHKAGFVGLIALAYVVQDVAKAVGLMLSAIAKACECDCSPLAGVCGIAADIAQADGYTWARGMERSHEVCGYRHD